MADPKQHKTPEELGVAVGRKIDELFGSMFADEAPEPAPEPAPPPPARGMTAARPAGTSGPMATTPFARPPVRSPEPPLPPPKPAARPVAPVPPQQKPAARPVPTPPFRPAPAGAKPSTAALPATRSTARTALSPKPPVRSPKVSDGFDDIVEQIEILVLNLEWEVSPDSVKELEDKFRRLETFFPSEGQARTILAMNRRGLTRFTGPDAIPHPALIKLLQESVSALKVIHGSAGKRPAGEALIAGLTASYKEIMGPRAATENGEEEQALGDARRAYGTLLGNVGNAVQSLEEVSRRLNRILGVLRQGGEMSGEEVARRLNTLEHLLAERVGQLVSFHKELAETSRPGDEGALLGAGGAAAVPDGLLLMMWYSIPMAIPSSFVVALYPLTRAQAEQFAAKQSITLGNHPVQMLPLKKPASAAHQAALPSWLVHLSGVKGEFFLLLEKTLGFRRTPEGVDIYSQQRIKMGPTSYAVLSHSALR